MQGPRFSELSDVPVSYFFSEYKHFPFIRCIHQIAQRQQCAFSRAGRPYQRRDRTFLNMSGYTA